jgi:4-hydroxybenzoate polyprenyltransferase
VTPLKKDGEDMKLAIAQMVLGGIILAYLWLPWVFGIPPSFVLGLAVFGCGMAQLLKALKA